LQEEEQIEGLSFKAQDQNKEKYITEEKIHEAENPV
jgi:hypothetical protein